MIVMEILCIGSIVEVVIFALLFNIHFIITLCSFNYIFIIVMYYINQEM
jgi:hypothetical protein